MGDGAQSWERKTLRWGKSPFLDALNNCFIDLQSCFAPVSSVVWPWGLSGHPRLGDSAVAPTGHSAVLLSNHVQTSWHRMKLCQDVSCNLIQSSGLQDRRQTAHLGIIYVIHHCSCLGQDGRGGMLGCICRSWEDWQKLLSNSPSYLRSHIAVWQSSHWLEEEKHNLHFKNGKSKAQRTIGQSVSPLCQISS